VVALLSYVTSELVGSAMAHPLDGGNSLVQTGIGLLNAVFDISTCLALIVQRLTIPWYLTKAYYICAGVVRYAVGLIIVSAVLYFPARSEAQQILDGNGNQAYMPFAIFNGWTNSVVFAFQDQNGNWPNVVLQAGKTFHGVTGWNFIPMWDYNVWVYFLANVNGGSQQYNNGYSAPQYADGLSADGSTNGAYFMATFFPLDQGVQDVNGNELYNPGANLLQGPSVLFQLQQSQVQIPPVAQMYGLADFLEFWFYGVAVAWVLYLTGSMRRLLGRVHEVNTDL
jgi:hypothetical protein